MSLSLTALLCNFFLFCSLWIRNFILTQSGPLSELSGVPTSQNGQKNKQAYVTTDDEDSFKVNGGKKLLSPTNGNDAGGPRRR